MPKLDAMPDEKNSTIENLLRRYYAATAGADDLLDALLTRVRPAVRQRLANRGVTGDECDDLCADTLARLVHATQKSHLLPQKPIENYLHYALTVADRVFADAMREKRPNWCRLKRKIVYLLDGKAGGRLFARWTWNAGWLGGFARWRGKAFASTMTYQTFLESEAPFCKQALENRSPEQVPLPELVALLLRWLDTPLELDTLTGHIATLQNVKEADFLSLDDCETTGSGALARRRANEIEDVSQQVLNELESRTFQKHLWQIIGELPHDQRTALLLSMAPDMLLLLGLQSEIAAAVQIPREEFLPLWANLPLPDATIAARLKHTVKQTQNLRQIARKRILRHLAKARG